MLKLLQIVVGAVVAFLVGAYVEDNFVAAAFIGLLAALAVARIAMWRHPSVYDPDTRSWHFGPPIHRRRS